MWSVLCKPPPFSLTSSTPGQRPACLRRLQADHAPALGAQVCAQKVRFEYISNHDKKVDSTLSRLSRPCIRYCDHSSCVAPKLLSRSVCFRVGSVYLRFPIPSLTSLVYAENFDLYVGLTKVQCKRYRSVLKKDIDAVNDMLACLAYYWPQH